MTAPVSTSQPAAIPVPATLSQKAAQIIEDPFGSVIAGLVAPTAAVAVVISAIYGLALIH